MMMARRPSSMIWPKMIDYPKKTRGSTVLNSKEYRWWLLGKHIEIVLLARTVHSRYSTDTILSSMTVALTLSVISFHLINDKCMREKL